MKLSGWLSSAARSCIRRATCISFRPSPMAVNLLLFSAAGISSNSSSIFVAPMLASIAAMSCSVCGMKGMFILRIEDRGSRIEKRFSLAPRSSLPDPALMCFAIDYRLIRRGIHQRGYIRHIVRLHPEHPRGVRVGVDLLRGAVQFAVYRRHFAGNRRIYVRCGFYRFHHRDFFLGLYLAADCRGFDKYHIAQQFLRVLGDADADGAVGFSPGPFVGGGVFQIARVAHAVLQ